MNIPFEQIWEEFIKPLEGKKVYTLDERKPNMIVKVTDENLERDTENNSPSQTIPKEVFEVVYNYVIDKGLITRVEINEKMPKRFSSIVCAILAEVPNIRFELNPIVLHKK